MRLIPDLRFSIVLPGALLRMPGPDLDAEKAHPTESGPCGLVWFCLAPLSRDAVLSELGGKSTWATHHGCAHLQTLKVINDRLGLARVRSSQRRTPVLRGKAGAANQGQGCGRRYQQGWSSKLILQ